MKATRSGPLRWFYLYELDGVEHGDVDAGEVLADEEADEEDQGFVAGWFEELLYDGRRPFLALLGRLLVLLLLLVLEESEVHFRHCFRLQTH